MTVPFDATHVTDQHDDPWLIAETDYPVQGTSEERLAFLVGYAILAPSRYNRQPWCFTPRDTVIELRMDQTRLLPVTDSRGREAMMNCGTALYYLQTAMQYFGHTPVVEAFPSPVDTNLLARVRQGEAAPPTEAVKALFHAIRHRRTFEQHFRSDPISSGVFQSLHTVATDAGTSLVFLEEEGHRQIIADMVVEGEKMLQDNPDYRQEATEWATEGEPKNWLATIVTRLWETFAPQQVDSSLILEAPALAVLCTEDDTPYNWLAAGQALGAVLLTADAMSVQASFLNQPIEVPSIRPRLQRLVGGLVPQLILRMGVMEGDYQPHSPRRGTAEVECLTNRLPEG